MLSDNNDNDAKAKGNASVLTQLYKFLKGKRTTWNELCVVCSVHTVKCTLCFRCSLKIAQVFFWNYCGDNDDYTTYIHYALSVHHEKNDIKLIPPSSSSPAKLFPWKENLT